MSRCRTPMIAQTTLPVEVLCEIFRVDKHNDSSDTKFKAGEGPHPSSEGITHRVVFTR